eukprot:5391511-Prymnesium_polylepis.1
MSGYDLSIENAWTCPDMLVLTLICLCQHLSLTQGFRFNVRTQPLAAGRARAVRSGAPPHTHPPRMGHPGVVTGSGLSMRGELRPGGAR